MYLPVKPIHIACKLLGKDLSDTCAEIILSPGHSWTEVWRGCQQQAHPPLAETTFHLLPPREVVSAKCCRTTVSLSRVHGRIGRKEGEMTLFYTHTVDWKIFVGKKFLSITFNNEN